MSSDPLYKRNWVRKAPALGKWGMARAGGGVKEVPPPDLWFWPLFPHSAPGCHQPDGDPTPPTQETQATFSGEEDLFSGTPRKRSASHPALLGPHKELLVHVEGQPRNSTNPPPPAAPKGKDQIIHKCWKNGDKAGSLGMPATKKPLEITIPRDKILCP